MPYFSFKGHVPSARTRLFREKRPSRLLLCIFPRATFGGPRGTLIYLPNFGTIGSVHDAISSSLIIDDHRRPELPRTKKILLIIFFHRRAALRSGPDITNSCTDSKSVEATHKQSDRPPLLFHIRVGRMLFGHPLVVCIIRLLTTTVMTHSEAGWLLTHTLQTRVLHVAKALRPSSRLDWLSFADREIWGGHLILHACPVTAARAALWGYDSKKGFQMVLEDFIKEAP